MDKEREIQWMSDLYGAFFDEPAAVPDEDVFAVEIVATDRPTYWYADRVGKVFHVADVGGDDAHGLLVVDIFWDRYYMTCYYINKNDAVKVGGSAVLRVTETTAKKDLPPAPAPGASPTASLAVG